MPTGRKSRRRFEASFLLVGFTEELQIRKKMRNQIIIIIVIIKYCYLLLLVEELRNLLVLELRGISVDDTGQVG